MLNSNETRNTATSSDIPLNLSETINSEENVNLSMSSAKRKPSTSIARVNNNEKPIESGNVKIKPPINNDNIEPPPSTRHSAVTVRRVNKSLDMNESNDKPQIIDQRISSTITPKSNRVNVIKIPREKSNTKPPEPSSSISRINVTTIEKPSIESKTTSSAGVRKSNNTTDGVSVKKLPRNSAKN